MAATELVRRDFGTRMKKQREEHGVTLRQIADSTKISVGILEALERNDVSRLPGGIFSRAFLRLYAAEIGLDPEQTVLDFLTSFPGDSAAVGTSYDSDAATPRRPAVHVVVLGVIVFSAIVGAILFVTLASR